MSTDSNNYGAANLDVASTTKEGLEAVNGGKENEFKIAITPNICLNINNIMKFDIKVNVVQGQTEELQQTELQQPELQQPELQQPELQQPEQ